MVFDKISIFFWFDGTAPEIKNLDGRGTRKVSPVPDVSILECRAGDVLVLLGI